MLGILVACDRGDDKNEDKRPAEPSQLIQDAAKNIDEAEAFVLELEHRGPDILLNVESAGVNLSAPLTMNSVQAVFVSPNKMQAEVSVSLLDASEVVNVIAIDDQQYINSNVITNSTEWQEFTFTDFQPQDLQSVENGIGSALRSMQAVTLIGETERDEIDVYHLRGTVEAAQVRSLTVGLIGTQEGQIKVDLFVRTRDAYPAEIILTEPIAPDSQSTEAGVWTIRLSLYNNDNLRVDLPEISTAQPENE